jgi:pseudaminic acid synthase
MNMSMSPQERRLTAEPPSFFIADRKVSLDSPTLIIAELSANHLQDKDTALRTIKAAAESGADVLKLQTYSPDTITLNCNNAHFRLSGGTIWDGQTLHDLYASAYMPWEWHSELKEYAESLGLICFSSPFDETAVDLLESLDVPAYKIASFEINHIPLISYIAKLGKPMILSTGLAGIDDIELALATCREAGNDQVALLRCCSGYPAPFEGFNLATISDMQERFGTVVGLSDHSPGHSVAVAAVALGARIVEKHFILSRSLGGPDSSFSMEPKEFREMVTAIREAEAALGKSSCYEVPPSSLSSLVFKRSLFVSEDVKAGDIATVKNVRCVRPGVGAHPKHLTEILGKKFCRDVKMGEPLELDMIES